MNLSLPVLAFLIGCAAIFIAIIGKEIVVKEVRIPELNPMARVLSGLFGILLIAGSAGILNQLQYSPFPKKAEKGLPAPASRTSPAAAPALPSPASIAPPTPAAAPMPAPQSSPAISSPPSTTKKIRISDSLGEHQDYERINILINDLERASISIDKLRPRQSITLAVSPGDRYSLVGTQASRKTGDLVIRNIRGHGKFRDTDHTRYSLVEGLLDGNIQKMSIEEEE